MRREFPEAPIVGVGAVVIDGDRVLLVKRGQEPLKGEWSLPGGAVELGETLSEGIIRELAEETGLAVEVLAIVEVLDRIVLEDADQPSVTAPAAKKRIRYHYVLIDFLCRVISGDLHAASDADDVAWVPRRELGSKGAYPVAAVTAMVIDKAFRQMENL